MTALGKILIPVIFLGFLLGLCMWLGRDIKPDLSNDMPDYYEDGGNGHPLWR